ncbi:hypothetical protein V2G26_004985 [Clonostachys chloroleuca]
MTVKFKMTGKVIYNAKVDYDLPDLDLLTVLFESAHVPSEDSTVLHVEASHPENIITKAQTASYTKHVAHILRHQYQIGASGPGKDVVVCISSGQVLLPTIFYGTIAAGGFTALRVVA